MNKLTVIILLSVLFYTLSIKINLPKRLNVIYKKHLLCDKVTRNSSLIKKHLVPDNISNKLKLNDKKQIF